MSLGSLNGIDAFERLPLRLPSVAGPSASFLEDLCDAFDDDEVLGLEQACKPPFILLPTRDLRMKFDLKGPEDGPKLLYIPGATDDLRKTLSSLHCDAFARKFRTLTCDLRNQGETTPFAVNKYLPLETYIDDLLALVDNVFGPEATLHVAGWSFGAALALLMARLHPGRVQSVAVLAGGYWEPSTEHQRRLSPGGEALFGRDWKWMNTLSSYATLDTEKRCEQMLCHSDVRRADSDFREKMLPSFEWLLDNYVRSENVTVMNSPRSCKELGKGVLLQATALYVQGTVQVEDISAPTIIIHGRHDGMHSVDRAVALKKKMKSAMLVVMEDEGHVIVMAAVETASSFMHPQFKVAPRLQDKEHEFSYSRANAAFEEISVACKKESCQKRLDTVFGRYEVSEEERELQCHQICLSVQRPILEKYGIPCTVIEIKAKDQSWLACPLRWLGSATDSAADPDWVVELLSRRLAALEKYVVLERRKLFIRRAAESNARSRSQLYSQQKLSSKQVINTPDPAGIPSPADTEDFIRRALLHSSHPHADKEMDMKHDGYNIAADTAPSAK